MKLLTNELRAKLPTREELEGQGDPVAIVKLFHPLTNWTWYIIAFDGQDTCYGFVIGHEREFGDFSLCELAAIGKWGDTLPVERDLYFEPTPMSKILAGEAN